MHHQVPQSLLLNIHESLNPGKELLVWSTWEMRNQKIHLINLVPRPVTYTFTTLTNDLSNKNDSTLNSNVMTGQKFEKVVIQINFICTRTLHLTKNYKTTHLKNVIWNTYIIRYLQKPLTAKFPCIFSSDLLFKQN